MERIIAKKPAHNNGLYLRIENEVKPEVREQCIEFIKWLQKQMQFPIKLIIHLKKDYYILTRNTKECVSATFWGPYNKKERPIISVATGDYQDILIEYGKYNALKAILGSITHEIIHYQQWLNNLKFSEKEAEVKSKRIVFHFIDFETNKYCQRIEELSKQLTLDSLDELLSLFDKGSPKVKIHVIESLKSFSKFEIAKLFLIKLLYDIDYEICCNALISLSYFKGEEVNNAVINCLHDPNKDVRIEAAKSLQYIGDRKSVTPLIASLDDHNELVRGYAAVSLGVIGGKEIIPIIKKKLLDEKHNAARLRMFVGLYYLGEKDYLSLIINQLKSRSCLVRFAAPYYLAEIADETNTEQIIGSLKIAIGKEKRKDVRVSMKEALKKIRNKQ